MNKAIKKGYLKNMNEELMKSDIDYDLLALGLGRACNLKNQNKYITDIGTYSKNLKKMVEKVQYIDETHLLIFLFINFKKINDIVYDN